MNPEEKTLALLKEAHDAPLNEAHYAAVRARVLGQLEARRRAWRTWLWASAFAAVAVWAALNVGRTPRLTPVPVQTPVLHAVAHTEPAAEPAREAAPRQARVHRVRRPRTQGAAVVGPPAIQPLMVKLITNDPNVVIYWFTGE